MTLNISVTDEQLGRFFRRACAIAERLGKSLSYDDVMDEFQKIHDGKSKTNNSIPCRLYPDEEIWVSATTGKKTIARSSNVFKGWIDLDFENWGTDKQGSPTERTNVGIYEIKKDATFEQMFTSFGKIDNLCFEQEQIINFCLEHPDKLRKDGHGNFFLFKVGGLGRPFVAGVRFYTDGLCVRVFHFGYGGVWGAGPRHCVVVPQILVD